MCHFSNFYLHQVCKLYPAVLTVRQCVSSRSDTASHSSGGPPPDRSHIWRQHSTTKQHHYGLLPWIEPFVDALTAKEMTLTKPCRKRVVLQTNKSVNWNFSESYCGELPSQSSWCGGCPGVLGPDFDSAELLVQRQDGPLPHGSALLCCIQTPPRRMCAENSLPWTQGWHSDFIIH